MKLSTVVTVTCCDFARNYRDEYRAIQGLMRHIRRNHGHIVAKIEKTARQLARSQNGCGYYDGSDSDTGWPKAPATFREAWRENALRSILRMPLNT